MLLINKREAKAEACDLKRWNLGLVFEKMEFGACVFFF